MIPSSLCKLSSEWAIQPEAVTLLVNQKGVDLHTLIAGLYADTDQRMRAVQKQIEDSEENIKLCSVIGNMDIPEENQYSQYFHLSKLRCTNAYRDKLTDENFAKQTCNGMQNLKVDLEIPPIPFGLATVLFDVVGVPIRIEKVIDENGVEVEKEVIPCIDRESKNVCNSNCVEKHRLASEFITNTGVSSKRSQLRARFIKSYVDSLVQNVIAPLTQHHHLQLEFLRNGTIKLVGNVWIKELDVYNETGEILTDLSVIPPYFLEDMGMDLNVEKAELLVPYENEPVSESTANCLVENEGRLSEGSVQELIHKTGRGLTTIWTDQTVVKVNINHPATMKHMCRKLNGFLDQNQIVFQDPAGEMWAKLPTWRVKFCIKPPAVKHLILGQFVSQFEKARFRYHNKELITQQLNENGGILGNSTIRVITNTERFPQEIKFLPDWIMLKNGTILKRKNEPSVILPSGNLDNFGMRVLCEPFESEQELIEEENQLPSIEILKQRMKVLFPMSSFDVSE